MLTAKNLESFTSRFQTSPANITREYFQHLFLSYLYQETDSDRLLFKGGTALRIVLQSQRFSEDLDFTGSGIPQSEIEDLFVNVLGHLEKTGLEVELNTAKNTTGGYLGNASVHAFGRVEDIHIEVSLRNGRRMTGIQKMIEHEYFAPYTLVHLSIEDIVQGKLDALFSRHKPRDFYDYFFLLSRVSSPPIVRSAETLRKVLTLLEQNDIDFRFELKKFLPKSHAMLLRDFRSVLERKIAEFT